ncbi:MAG: pyruvate dehydrogenase (acetyl-transferring), homodimeric type [Gammaproteobacteria bacterium TMED243]|nr:pyruvate dehydrogenase (acetyl-transferring), homodimeric type [Gammaproteobacteria bacterium]RPG34133.1 MAG: pyruvate dehydrogenase (acetyl-transferring), homodimeric type [Gammaproteobacteria bacterium TMED243]
MQGFDAEEQEEWLDALEGVLKREGVAAASALLQSLAGRLTRTGASLPFAVSTPYRNTIPSADETPMPGDLFMERRIRSLIRWNALAMVVRANRRPGDLGGHISSFASSATLYDVGFNYFFRAPEPADADGNVSRSGDLVYFQGHASPGIYARSFLEGRLSEEQLDNFRRETGSDGLSSYPHPWLMPDYWQFPTVSMGLGPLQAIYQAHVMKYLDSRGLVEMGNRKVWAFLGDGECDEPESLGALSLAGREKLDNLIFVVNCNLQRLDGPVRGNGKIIQELEGYFRGAGWNVIKVVWGRHWDPLFAKDSQGLMQRAMDATVDGEYQNFKAKGGKYVRDNFFAKDPELLRMVEHLSDDDIYRLNRGGHDPYKVYAAYHAATNHTGQPTVILAKTVKGYGMGDAGESENTTHQVKKLDLDELKYFRDRFDVPLSDDQLQDVPYYRPAADSSEMQYLRQSRERLGGFMPRRLVDQETLTVPPLSAFKAQIGGTGEREVSSTMAFVRILATLLRDKHLGKRVVPIVPDEARTFGMEGMFRQLGIYSSEGQLYEPEDSDELAAYKESKSGQVLEEGINEAGAFAAWMAAATSYSTHQYTLLPFYIYYSMFGFQRIGDLAWAAGDLQAKGFLLGGTAGRTTLNGEGLQHQDGHSHVLAATVPNCISYDPAYAFELAVIIRRGLEHMYVEQAPVYYYLTLMNEAYQHPAMPEGVEADIVKGMYLLETLGEASAPKIRLLGSGALLPEARSAAQRLVDDFGLQVQVYSVTSYTELARNVQDHQRDVLLDGENVSVSCHVSDLLNNNDWSEAPVVAVSDYVKSLPEQVRSAIDSPFRVLGTDGFGRSDTREQLRAFFEVDRRFIQYSALSELVAAGHMQLDLRHVREQLGIDTHKPNPRQH